MFVTRLVLCILLATVIQANKPSTLRNPSKLPKNKLHAPRVSPFLDLRSYYSNFPPLYEPAQSSYAPSPAPYVQPQYQPQYNYCPNDNCCYELRTDYSDLKTRLGHVEERLNHTSGKLALGSRCVEDKDCILKTCRSGKCDCPNDQNYIASVKKCGKCPSGSVYYNEKCYYLKPITPIDDGGEGGSVRPSGNCPSTNLELAGDTCEEHDLIFAHYLSTKHEIKVRKLITQEADETVIIWMNISDEDHETVWRYLDDGSEVPYVNWKCDEPDNEFEDECGSGDKKRGPGCEAGDVKSIIEGPEEEQDANCALVVKRDGQTWIDVTCELVTSCYPAYALCCGPVPVYH